MEENYICRKIGSTLKTFEKTEMIQDAFLLEKLENFADISFATALYEIVS
jgi:hypothetical protein